MSTNNPNPSSGPRDYTEAPRHGSNDCSAYVRSVRCMTVRQLYPQDMQTLSTFVRACSDGVLLVTPTPLAEA
ncbi:hypothetical protein K458DRAFT_422790 [Lentithecium fluviatile CBS 122367]|uniref:Uncharacterized protein n=1 Tax=Lentithecium fluviatile CBS 122367 TaxID=1168545 RepID=A0A6G1IL14_9PLEO|nr:hypothetical protein K458DRAFT_422790 [Lentithecium fluviatile CBS 122367]